MYQPLYYRKPVFTNFGLSQLRHKKFICILILFAMILICFSMKDNPLFSVYIYRTSTGLECYKFLQKDKEVLNVPDYKVLPNSIFFLETSCRHGSGIDITKRQACAYESAAKVHPTSEVLVLFPSPISLKKPSMLVTELLKYPNIKLLHVDMERYFLGTPMEDFYVQNRIEKSYWPKSHMSDVLRYLTLWKYGGTYLDSDIVMIRPINTMENFAGAESKTDIAAGFLNFNISNSGRQIIDEMLMEIRDNFRGWDWGANGPGVISRVLRRICKEDNVLRMTPEKCNGFTVFPPSAFYPISWRNWRMYFREHVSQAFLDRLSESFGIHVWNMHSSNTPVKVGSRMPYAVFASKFCPRVYSVVGSYL